MRFEVTVLVVDLDVSLALALLRNVSMMLKLLVSLMPKLLVSRSWIT